MATKETCADGGDCEHLKTLPGNGTPESRSECLGLGYTREHERAERLAARVSELEAVMSPSYVAECESAKTRAEGLAKELAEARFRPMGDNHHNAAQCPYCGDPLRAATARVAELEKQLAAGEASLDAELATRDRYHETADDLTAAIAKHFAADFGEHSSGNEAYLLPAGGHVIGWHEGVNAGQLVQVVDHLAKTLAAPLPSAQQIPAPAIYCSFCVKPYNATNCFIKSGGAYICDECVDMCVPLVAAYRADHPAAPAQPRVQDGHGFYSPTDECLMEIVTRKACGLPRSAHDREDCWVCQCGNGTHRAWCQHWPIATNNPANHFGVQTAPSQPEGAPLAQPQAGAVAATSPKKDTIQ